FEKEGEEAARFYVSIFPNSRIVDVSSYSEAGPRQDEEVTTVSFELNGQEFMALNGGPQFTFNEAISFQVFCDDQEELDRYWSALLEGGQEIDCGWLKDRYGLAWQIIPTRLIELLKDPAPGRSRRTMQAMLEMKKLEIAELEAAADAA